MRIKIKRKEFVSDLKKYSVINSSKLTKGIIHFLNWFLNLVYCEGVVLFLACSIICLLGWSLEPWTIITGKKDSLPEIRGLCVGLSIILYILAAIYCLIRMLSCYGDREEYFFDLEKYIEITDK